MKYGPQHSHVGREIPPDPSKDRDWFVAGLEVCPLEFRLIGLGKWKKCVSSEQNRVGARERISQENRVGWRSSSCYLDFLYWLRWRVFGHMNFRSYESPVRPDEQTRMDYKSTFDGGVCFPTMARVCNACREWTFFERVELRNNELWLKGACAVQGGSRSNSKE